MSDAESVLKFWLQDVGPAGWYVSFDAVDDTIRNSFGDLVAQAIDGKLDHWTASANGTLALLILLDQFPRNLNRGSADAFAGDAAARRIARIAICKNFDLETAEPGRQFFYLPFEHSEEIADQDWCVTLFETRMSGLTEESMHHIRQHREMIVRFGRFPFRNEALNREPTPDEAAFMAEGGYTPGLQPKE